MCVPLELNNAGVKVPYTINRYLRDYQREGIKFLYNNYIRSRGCILGDDMGLGKTVQVRTTTNTLEISCLLLYYLLHICYLGYWLPCCFVAQKGYTGGH